MNIKNMPLEELELLSYTDIAYEILKEEKKPMSTPALFKKVCELLNIDDDAMMEMIGDFYTTLTTDKRFILLDNAEWDLKEFHSVKTVVDDEDDEEQEEEEDEEVIEGTEDDAVTGDDDTSDFDDIDDDLDDLDDLAIVSEDELEE